MKLTPVVAVLLERAQQARDAALDERAAKIWETAAQLVEKREREWMKAELTLEQAAAEGGYTVNRLRDLVREGKIPNAAPEGRGYAILREHVPIRPGHTVATTCQDGDHSFSRIARAVAEIE